MLNQLGWLSVRQLAAYHSLVLISKIKESGKPVYFEAKFKNPYPRVTRLSIGNQIWVEQKIRNRISKLNFSYRTVCDWNELPRELRLVKKLPEFKDKLKEWTKKNVAVR